VVPAPARALGSGVYQVDRPFLPWIYMLTTPVVGEAPSVAIAGSPCASRNSGGPLVAYPLDLAPQAALALLTALFFVVYPGFLQGPISLIYSHYFLLYALLLASLVFSVWAVRREVHR